MNGLVKVPMQFLILLIGALLFTFYQFKPSPVFHNRAVEEKAMLTPYKDSLAAVQQQYRAINNLQNNRSFAYLQSADKEATINASFKDSLQHGNMQMDSLRVVYKSYIKQAVPLADINDTNYIFLRFVVDYLPVGLIGLLIAIIFLAAWGSIAAALNSLASCSMIDFHNRFRKPVIMNEEQDGKDYKLSKWYTFAWGVFCIIVAQFANRMGSLIEAVNILGSLFYGVILGIFLVAFYLKKVGGRAVFISAIISEILIITLFILNSYGMFQLSFLWLNAVGALLVVGIALVLQKIVGGKVVGS